MGGILTRMIGVIPAVASVWTTVWGARVGFATNSGGWSGFTMRERLFNASLTDAGGSQIRISVKSWSATQLKIAKMYVGVKGTGTYDFASAPTQITFDGGSASVLIASGSVIKVSDAVVFSYNGTSDLVISVYHDATASYTGSNSATNSTVVSKAGDDAITTTATGYSTGTINDLIYQIEVLVP